MERCEECGYEYDLATAPRLADQISSRITHLVDLLNTTERSTLARRTSPDMWSPLEYCCHIRDVLLTQRERVLLARRVDTPTAVPMGRDERITHDGYGDQDPVQVAEELTMAARLLANALNRLGDTDWELRLVYTWPEHTERTLRWLAAHTLHEVTHHALDVRRQIV